MTLASRCHFLRRRTGNGSARAAVKADPFDGAVVVDDCRVVGIVYDGDVHVGHRAIVVIRAASPVAAEKPGTGVAETVVNAAVEADFRSPVSRGPSVEAIFERPIPWSPEQTDFRREHPRARNPEITIRPIGPIAGNPNVAWLRTDGLHIHWQHRRTNPNGDADSSLRSGFHRDRE